MESSLSKLPQNVWLRLTFFYECGACWPDRFLDSNLADGSPYVQKKSGSFLPIVVGEIIHIVLLVRCVVKKLSIHFSDIFLPCNQRFEVALMHPCIL